VLTDFTLEQNRNIESFAAGIEAGGAKCFTGGPAPSGPKARRPLCITKGAQRERGLTLPRERGGRPKLVVIGNGMAAGRMLEELFERAPGHFDVTIFGSEPRVNYNRIMLSPVLAGEKTYEEIIIHGDDWYAQHGISLHKGKTVAAIDRAAKTVTTACGHAEPYDRLIIATGSTPIAIPVHGVNLPGVVTFRDLDDVEVMLRQAEKGGRAVVIGGGLLGLEAAAGLKAKGMAVSVVHLMPSLMERQLDASAGYLLQKALEQRGISVFTGASTQAILGESRVEAVKLGDGRILDADIVVMAVGIRPNARLAKEAGLWVDRGIVVDDTMRTSDPSIYALGECAEHRGQCYGLVAPLFDMAKVLAAQLCGETHAAYQGSFTSARLKVTGIDLFSAGNFSQGSDEDEIVLRDPARGVYKRIAMRDNRIAGIVLYGDAADCPWYFDLMKKGADVNAMREKLILGQAYQGGAPLDPAAAIAALPDDAEICGCNGVCKKAIVSAIAAKGLTSLEEVRGRPRPRPPVANARPRSKRSSPRCLAAPIRQPSASRCANALILRMRRFAGSFSQSRCNRCPRSCRSSAGRRLAAVLRAAQR
jgi:nitrite reductase (NADH) large subunit